MAEPKVVIVAVIQCQARSFASPVPIAVACALVGTGALVISSLILDRPQLHTAVNALNLLIALAVAVCLMTAVGTLSLLRPRADRFGAVITMGWPLLGMAGAVALCCRAADRSEAAGDGAVVQARRSCLPVRAHAVHVTGSCSAFLPAAGLAPAAPRTRSSPPPRQRFRRRGPGAAGTTRSAS